MTNTKYVLVVALVLSVVPSLHGQATEGSISAQLQALGVGAGSSPMMPGPGGPGGPRAMPMPDAQRPAAVLQAAKDIRTLPAGPSKVRFAESLYHAAVQGVVGAEALQTTADTLAQALGETPQPLGKDGLPARGYMDLAKLKQLAGITTDLKDPMLTKAEEILTANQADLAKVDFTLRDVNGKKWTLSALKGKIVLINFWFWSPQCEICHKEMQDLDLIYTHYQSQGLVILSVVTTPDDLLDLNHLVTYLNFHPPVLLDNGGKVGQAFHVDSRPQSFVFDRDGKLVGESLDVCTQRQFFTMLGKAGLHP